MAKRSERKFLPFDKRLLKKKLERIAQLNKLARDAKIAKTEAELKRLRKKYAHPGRELIKPTGKPSVSIKKISEAVRKKK